MKNGKEFSVVGDVPDEVKRAYRQQLELDFSNHASFCRIQNRPPEFGRPPHLWYEFAKTPTELAILAFVNEETNRLMTAAGVEPFDLSPNHHHLVPPQTFKFQVRLMGANPRIGRAFVDSEKEHAIYKNLLSHQPVLFGVTALHETLHLKSRAIIELKAKDFLPCEVYRHRRGLGEYLPGKTTFAGLDEAVVEEQTKRSLPRLLELPELASEKEWLLSAEANAQRQRISAEDGIVEDEIFWIDKNNQNRWEAFTYSAQRAVLNHICREIQKDRSKTFKTREEVFQELFLKAHFTAITFDLGVTTSISFGEMGRRFLERMDGDDRRAKLSTLESLREKRKRQTISMFVCGPSDCRIDTIPANLPEE